MCFIFLWSFDTYMWPQIDPFNASCWVLVHIHRWLSRNTFFTQKVRTPYCEIHCHDLDFTKKLIHFSSLHRCVLTRSYPVAHFFKPAYSETSTLTVLLYLNAAKGVHAEFFLETKAKYVHGLDEKLSKRTVVQFAISQPILLFHLNNCLKIR